MKTFRQFSIRVIEGQRPRLCITDPNVDIRKIIPLLTNYPLAEAINYIESIGIRVEGITRAIRVQDVRIITNSEMALK